MRALKFKSWYRLGVAIGFAVGVALPASAGSLSTSNSVNDGSSSGTPGTFFDLAASTNVSLTQLDVYSFESNDPSDFQIDLYYRVGTYMGNQADSGAWTLFESFVQGPNGEDVIDPLLFSSPLAMSGGETFGFYVVAIEGGLQWEDNNQLRTNSNGDLTITTYETLGTDETNNGTSAFFAETKNFRTFVGTVHYTSVAAIPEPEIYAMMAAGLGLMGWVTRRRKQQLAA